MAEMTPLRLMIEQLADRFDDPRQAAYAILIRIARHVDTSGGGAEILMAAADHVAHRSTVANWSWRRNMVEAAEEAAKR